MATVRQRGGRWRVMIRRKGHRPIYETFTKKSHADRFVRETESAIDAGRYQDTHAAEKITVHAACEWHLSHILPVREKTSHIPDLARIRTIQRHLGTYTLAGLTIPAVLAFVDARLQKVSSDAIRKELHMLTDVIDTAMAMRQIYMPSNPVREARAILRKLRRLTPGRHRERRLLAGEYEKIARAPHTMPTLINEVALFAIETAMRENELAQAMREHVDRSLRVLYVPKSKTDWKTGKKGRVVPLSAKAIEILDRLPLQIGGSLVGMQSGSIKQAFRRLCRSGGLMDLRFHDLRHEATSRLFDRGFEIYEVAAITGHRDWRSLKRYTHPDPVKMAAQLA